MATDKLSRYGNQQALEAVVRKTQSPAAGNVWLALLTAVPSQANLTMVAVTEYAGTGYARQVIAFGSASAAEPSVVANSALITFGPITVVPGSPIVTHWAICDAVSGTAANIIATGALGASRTPGVGDSLQGAIGAFTVSNN
jgi:hypothetical protein